MHSYLKLTETPGMLLLFFKCCCYSSNFENPESFHNFLSDNDPPVFTSCPGNIFKTTQMPSESVFWPNPIAEDNSLEVSVAGSHEPNSVFEVGVTEVNYTARDESDNTAECRFRVTVTLGKQISVSVSVEIRCWYQ